MIMGQPTALTIEGQEDRDNRARVYDGNILYTLVLYIHISCVCVQFNLLLFRSARVFSPYVDPKKKRGDTSPVICMLKAQC